MGARHTGSALVESSASFKETTDPIIYNTHQNVLDLVARLQATGSVYDITNNALILNSYPEWITDEDETQGEGTLKNLTQVMAGFFDDLFLKIKLFPDLKNISYDNNKPSQFGRFLLENNGFKVSDLFTDASVLENFLDRTEDRNFSNKLEIVKSTIYQNIYNNLLYIYRSKGTEKSIRNFIRCFGIDDEIIKINLYADNTEFTFDDRFKNTTERKKYINFNGADRYIGTVYQMTASNNDQNTRSYITGNFDFRFLGNTIECEAIFPKKFEIGNELYFPTPFVSCSIFRNTPSII